MASIELSNVRKSYDDLDVLKNVSLEIDAGEFAVFVGPSGCGKSSLLRAISGLESIQAGTIRIGGELANDLPPGNRGVAMVFQSYALYPHMTVAQNMSFGLRMAGAPKHVIGEKVRLAAEILQLGALLDRRPDQLSGGQKQRVAIGRAIVRDPRVFLFDEPLSNLDAELRVQMRAELSELHRTLGTTMIYVTHDQVEAMTLADKIVVLKGGVVQQVGAPLEIYHNPANRFVAGFIGSPKMNFVDVAVVGHESGRVTLRLPGSDTSWTMPLRAPPDDAKLSLGFRSDHVRLTDAVTASGPGVRGTVAFVEELGDATFAYLDVPGGARIAVRTPPAATRTGETHSVIIETAGGYLFGAAGERLISV